MMFGLSRYLTRALNVLSGINADAYEDDPIGENFWKDPEWGSIYRPIGKNYRIIKEGSKMLLEIQTEDGQWVEAQRYDHGYDSYGKLRKGAWGHLAGRYADSENSYHRIGSGLIGVPMERKITYER